MKLDGSARVLICGSKNAGKKTFVSAFLNMFTQYVFFGKSNLYISTADPSLPRKDEAEQIKAQAGIADFVSKSMSLDQAFRGEIGAFQNEIEFQLIIDTEFCGKIKFLNILGDYSSVCDEVAAYGLTTVVMVIDGENYENSDFYDLKGLIEQVRSIQPDNYPFSVLVAVSKADLFGVEKTQQVSFYQKCPGFIQMASFCSENKIPCQFTSFSAAGSETSRVFDSTGNLVFNPDYRPWNIENVGLCIISSALPILNTQYLREEEKCLDSIRRNRSFFNSDSFRSKVELEFSRTKFASVVQGKYHLDQYSRYSRQIIEYLRQGVFRL